MTFAALYRRARESLAAVCGDGAAYEARTLLLTVCGLTDADFPIALADSAELPAETVARVESLLARRQRREPLEYLLGRAWFCGLPFSVTPDCLIPQADTEVVCEQVISHLPQGGRLADLCTGSGCIALAALTHTKNTTAHGYELSTAALVVAEKNAEDLGLANRFAPIHADVLTKDFWADGEKYDVIVSNPPYIRTEVLETLPSEVQAEPRMALDGGTDGLRFYRRLLDVCPVRVREGGALIFEIGYDQRDALAALCAERELSARFVRDFGGNDRVCIITM